MKLVCIRYFISGRVQGVWYRSSTQKKAKLLNLKGLARNLDDGRVEVIVCGGETEIKQLEEWLWKGPIAAKVTDVQSEQILWQEFQEFSVE